MGIKDKLERIIPPNNYRHRYEFSNHHLVDELNDYEKKEIENCLIDKLNTDPADILVIETLSYMGSEKAIPAMRNSLADCENQLQKIIIAVSIYKINHENEMIDISIDAFEKLDDKWDLVIVFSYLKGFNNSKINDVIEEYIYYPDFLIAHNAKRALGIIE